MRRIGVLGWTAVMVAVLCAVVGAVMASPSAARALCIRGAKGPTTTVNLYDGRGRVVATMRVTPCGPQSSILRIESTRGRPKLTVDDFLLLHGGTCERPRPMPRSRGSSGYSNPSVTATRLSRSSFVIELTRAGAVAPYACGFHKGKLPLPPSRWFLGQRRIEKLTHIAGGYVVKGLVRLDSVEAGRRTSFTWVGGTLQYGSSGRWGRLRPGTCGHIEIGHEIVFDPWVTSTLIDAPLAELVERPYALEIMAGDASTSSPRIDTCYDF